MSKSGIIASLCLIVSGISLLSMAKTERDDLIVTEKENVFCSDAYYVETIDDKKMLHRCDILKDVDHIYSIYCKCGKIVEIKDQKELQAYYKEPKEEKYDFKCERCYDDNLIKLK